MMNRTAVASLALSAAALVGIALHEGYSPTAYTPVPGDVPTIGYGSTEGVKLGQSITPDRALVRLLADATKFEQAVKRCAPVPMTSNEFSAFVSLAYNVGETAFCNSTAARLLRAGDYEGACRQILRWDRFKGAPLAGLTKRRQQEFELCMRPA